MKKFTVYDRESQMILDQDKVYINTHGELIMDTGREFVIPADPDRFLVEEVVPINGRVQNYTEGEVVFVDQGHPDDNYYGAIQEILQDGVYVNGCPYSFSNIRKLSKQEKGD